MQITHIETLQDFVELSEPWNALAGEMPFRRLEWYATWWCHYGELGRLCVIGVRDDGGRLIGAAPWYVAQHPAKGRVVRFLADEEVCSDYQTVLCAPGHEDEVTNAIAGWLSQTNSIWTPGRAGAVRKNDSPSVPWDLLEFTGIETADRPMRRLASHLQSLGNRVHQQPAFNCWRLQLPESKLPESWDDYLAELSKSHRKRIRRLLRRALETGRAVWHTVETADELSAAFEILVDLHQRRWQSRGEPGAFSSQRFTAFHRNVAGKMLEAGRLRLHWLELDGQPAAAEYDFAGDGVVYAYQGGVNPDLLDQDPGSLCNVSLIRGALAEGCTSVDFLRGDEPYKAHWRAQPRPCHDLRVVPRRLTARLRHRAWTTGKHVKRWLDTRGGNDA